MRPIPEPYRNARSKSEFLVTVTIMGKSRSTRAIRTIVHPTPTELVNGWLGSDGIIVRLARPGDLPAVADLADLAGGPLEDQMRSGITDSATAGG